MGFTGDSSPSCTFSKVVGQGGMSCIISEFDDESEYTR